MESQAAQTAGSVRAAFLATGEPGPVQRAFTDSVDDAVIAAWQASIGRILPQSAALLATGAHGRKELFPYSDIDILILHRPDAREALKEELPHLLRLLWEKGLRMNPRACTVDECLGTSDLGVIAVLDRRLLAGQGGIAAELEGKLPGFLRTSGRDLASALCRLTRARHDRYGNTPYHPEPDVKDAPGGLRDLRFARRIGMLCPELAGRIEKLPDAKAFLTMVRCFLHFHAQNDRNVLDLAAQRALLEPPFPFTMSRYFEHAAAVFSRARRVIEAVESAESPSAPAPSAGFSVRAGRAWLDETAAIDTDPQLLSRAAAYVAESGTPLAAETERRLAAARAAWAPFYTHPEGLWPGLRSLLALPHAAAALRGIRSLLPLILPEWAGVERRIVTEADHSYVAGEHALKMMDRIAALRDASDALPRRFADLLSEIEDIPALLFAVLVHEDGAPRASEAAARLNVPAPEREMIEFLAGHRQDLTKAVSGRDLGDPATARLLADRVGTVERLKLLAVFSYADIAASYPETVLPWRLEQLWRTYNVTRQELTRELEADRIHDVPASLPAGAAFIRGFPVRYLRSHTAAEIELHTRLYQAAHAGGVAVQLDRTESAYRLTVVSRDMPFLFASLAGAISSFGLDIVQAEAFSNSAGIILDTFVFSDPRRTLELNPSEAERLQDLIRRVGLGKTDARRLLRGRAQPQPQPAALPPRVEFDSEACDTATLVEIVAEDRPGLLYSLANAISSAGCDIDVVLIDTKGRRAMDVFYLTHQGGKLDPELQAQLKDALAAAC